MVSVLIVAGEASSDLYAARLVRAVRKLRPDVAFFGLGGTRMASEGVELVCDQREVASIGPYEAVRRLPAYYRSLRRLLAEAERRGTRAAVLLDFPDFNLPLASRLKRSGTKTLYYIGPQVWAWRPGRVEKIRRLFDELLVILPFEEEFYRARGVAARYVGHPLAETLSPEDRKPMAVRSAIEPRIALLPGSRRGEVGYILPIMLEAARLISMTKRAKFLLSRAPWVDYDVYRQIIRRKGSGLELQLVEGESFELLASSDLALVKSGTSTLEAALAGAPMLVIYRISWPSWWVGRALIKTRYYSLVNLIAGEEVAPEFFQGAARPDRIAAAALKLLNDGELRSATVRKLAGIRAALGQSSASESVARILCRYIEPPSNPRRVEAQAAAVCNESER